MKKGKKTKFSKIYAFILSVMMIISTTIMVYADYTLYEFSINSYYPGHKCNADIKRKADDSSAIAGYMTGSASLMYFELWASDGTSADAANYTVAHVVNGYSVKYYTAKKGYYTMIPNLVYETYGKTVYTKLVAYMYNSGTATGVWSPTTK